MIEVAGVKKAFGNVKAVDGASFSAPDGMITGLLGPNGAGKTTTLRILYTLMKPDAGHISVDGIDTAKAPLEVRQRLGVLPDARGLYKRLTARENIAYFASLHGMLAETAKQRIEQLLETLDMLDIADRRAEGFSQGERVKTSLARALVHDPHNNVLDEPTSGLDVMTTRAMRKFLKGLKARGHCILISSHIMQEVATLCDQIVIMSNGRVVSSGTLEAILSQTSQPNLEEAFVALVQSSATPHASGDSDTAANSGAAGADE